MPASIPTFLLFAVNYLLAAKMPSSFHGPYPVFCIFPFQLHSQKPQSSLAYLAQPVSDIVVGRYWRPADIGITNSMSRQSWPGRCRRPLRNGESGLYYSGVWLGWAMWARSGEAWLPITEISKNGKVFSVSLCICVGGEVLCKHAYQCLKYVMFFWIVRRAQRVVNETGG